MILGCFSLILVYLGFLCWVLWVFSCVCLCCGFRWALGCFVFLDVFEYLGVLRWVLSGAVFDFAGSWIDCLSFVCWVNVLGVSECCLIGFG